MTNRNRDFHDALRIFYYTGALVAEVWADESAVVIGCLIGSISKALSASASAGIDADLLASGALPSELQ